MRTSSCKAKGRLLQKEVVAALLEAFKEELESDDVRSTSMGASGEDIQLSPKAAEVLWNFVFECKNTEKFNIYDAYDQCINHVKARRGINPKPVVVYRKNGRKKDTLAIIKMEHFVQLLQDSRELWQSRRP